MKITNKMLEDLLTEVRKYNPAHKKQSRSQSQFNLGAVWFGNWFKESGFGSKQKPLHFSAISRQPMHNKFFQLAPLTSKRSSGKKAIILPAGILKTGKDVDGYLLYNVKLRITGSRLKKNFKYKETLPKRYVTEMKKRMNHDR